MDVSSAQVSVQTEKDQSPKETALDLAHECYTGYAHSELSKEQKHPNSEDADIGSEPNGSISNCINTQDVTKDYVPEHARAPVEESKNSNNEEMASTVEDVIKNDTYEQKGSHTVCSIIENGSLLKNMSETSLSDHLEPPLEDATKDSVSAALVYPCEDTHKNNKELGSTPETATKIYRAEQLGPSSKYASKDCSFEQSVQSLTENAGRNERKSTKSPRRKNVLHSVRRSYRVLSLKSRDKPKDPEPNNNVTEANVVKEKKKKKRKVKKVLHDEFSRIRKNFKYMLHRMSYEQNLIEVYSGEGWKRLSVDKLKPEKELQRAASEILRCKRKVRDVLQRLDSLCAEGKFPESLFDSDGQIDSEDIFCAKCGSKDLSAGNDIILCDGACDRGFHQLCLEPPLSAEELPPDDEGWLCPGCDCKVDCMDMLNDSQGTKLSITKSWEKVFPEAAASACGNMQDDMFPSDDSEDDSYDPKASFAEEKSQEDGSSSDTCASDEFGSPAAAADDPLLSLPSDDSEDDDYDPSALDRLEQVNLEDLSSSSDFTSDSEDLGAVVDGNSSSPLNHERPESDDLLTTLEADPAEVDIAPNSERRKVERLDYKKLYDESYPNVPSSSSDDDDWTDGAAPRKRKNNTSSKKKTGQKSNPASETSSLVIPLKGYPSSSTKTPYRRHGDGVNQKLYAYFKENRYPDREAKEKLSQEVGMTVFQIGKWFGNARWSARHHPAGMCAKIAQGGQITPGPTFPGDTKPRDQSTQSTQSTSHQDFKELLDHVPKINSGDVNGVENKDEIENKESGVQKSNTPSSRKRKKTPANSDCEEVPKPTMESPNEVEYNDGTQNQESSGQKSNTPNSGKRKKRTVNLSSEEVPKPVMDSPAEGQKNSKMKPRRRSTS